MAARHPARPADPVRWAPRRPQAGPSRSASTGTSTALPFRPSRDHDRLSAPCEQRLSLDRFLSLCGGPDGLADDGPGQPDDVLADLGLAVAGDERYATVQGVHNASP